MIKLHRKGANQNYFVCGVVFALMLSGCTKRNHDSGAEVQKTILKTSPQDGFQISEAALKEMNVKVVQIDGQGKHSFPREALVYSLDRIAVYRLRDGWFQLVDATVIRQSNDSIEISSAQLSKGDSVAIQGAALLRVAEMEAFGGEK